MLNKIVLILLMAKLYLYYNYYKKIFKISGLNLIIFIKSILKSYKVIVPNNNIVLNKNRL